jgi:hypothetical protein
MKHCPKCGRSYSDPSINFCLEDGELLSRLPARSSQEMEAGDPPPTIMMDSPRVTRETNWQTGGPMQTWQAQSPQYQPPAAIFSGYPQTQSNVLPLISLIMGVAAFVFICCHGGLWLGVPAAIMGFIGMKNADNEPVKYGGRGMALGGMVLGSLSFLISMVILFVAILAG